MLYKEIARVIGAFLLLFSGCLIIPISISSYYQYSLDFLDHPQAYATIDFLYAFLISLALSCLFLWWGRNAQGILYRREGIAAVVFIWFLTPLIGALPFLTSGVLENPFQAYFETVSGFTTTGATILQAKQYDSGGKEIPIVKTIPGVQNTTYTFFGNVSPVRDPTSGVILKEGIEALGKGLLFWRSFTQWLGGGGIVVLFVAVLPLLGVGGKVLFQSEVAGPQKEGVTPRIKETAIELWRVYLVLTIAQVAAILYFTDVSFYDAFTITFSTLSTGGFSTKNSSIASFNSGELEWVVIVFMILGSINFSLFYFLLKGKFYRLYDVEMITFFVIIFLFGSFTVYSIWGTKEASLIGGPDIVFSGETALRRGLFQYISAQTSTGFVTSNFDVWPYSAQVILLVAMFLGGMSGSTAGGIKTIREYIMFRVSQYRVEYLFRQNHVKILKIQGKEIDNNTLTSVLCFFLIVVAVGTLGTFLYVLDGIDPETAIGLTACMLNNTGMSFRMAGPEYSCAFLSNFSLLLSSLMMILGRLEYYAVLALLVPAFWRQDS